MLFRNGYLGVSRPSNFTHDSWKQSMAVKKIRIIEKECKDFMEKMQYEKFGKNM